MRISKINEVTNKKDGTQGATWVRQADLEDGTRLQLSNKGYFAVIPPGTNAKTTMPTKAALAIGRDEVRAFLQHGDVAPFIKANPSNERDELVAKYVNEYKRMGLSDSDAETFAKIKAKNEIKDKKEIAKAMELAKAQQNQQAFNAIKLS